MVKISQKWDEILKEQFNSQSYLKLREFLKEEYFNYTVYPSMYDIFNSLKFVELDEVKVVLIGQDPYHEPNQAMGLSFSVPQGKELPPSLKNIYKELYDETGIKRTGGDLSGWAKQGVLLLNSVLTVRAHQANSHKGKGWEYFTDAVIKTISDLRENVVFLLWGANARAKKELIETKKHLVLECAHPSPLSAYNGFFGCNHFNKTNEYLIRKNIKAIDWSL